MFNCKANNSLQVEVRAPSSQGKALSHELLIGRLVSELLTGV